MVHSSLAVWKVLCRTEWDFVCIDEGLLYAMVAVAIWELRGLEGMTCWEMKCTFSGGEIVSEVDISCLITLWLFWILWYCDDFATRGTSTLRTRKVWWSYKVQRITGGAVLSMRIKLKCALLPVSGDVSGRQGVTAEFDLGRLVCGWEPMLTQSKIYSPKFRIVKVPNFIQQAFPTGNSSGHAIEPE